MIEMEATEEDVGRKFLCLNIIIQTQLNGVTIVNCSTSLVWLFGKTKKTKQYSTTILHFNQKKITILQNIAV